VSLVHDNDLMGFRLMIDMLLKVRDNDDNDSS
jgi:hypothetical protein